MKTWIERQRRRQAIIRQLGRGMSETTVPNGEDVDAAMVAKIQTEGTPEIDPFEAMRVIEPSGESALAVRLKIAWRSSSPIRSIRWTKSAATSSLAGGSAFRS